MTASDLGVSLLEESYYALVVIFNIDTKTPSPSRSSLLYFFHQYHSNLICLRYKQARSVISPVIEGVWCENDTPKFAAVPLHAHVSLLITFCWNRKYALDVTVFYAMLSLCMHFVGYHLDYAFGTVTLLKWIQRQTQTSFRSKLINVALFDVWKGDATTHINKMNTRQVVSTFLQHHATMVGFQLKYKYGNVFERRERFNCDIFDDRSIENHLKCVQLLR